MGQRGETETEPAEIPRLAPIRSTPQATQLHCPGLRHCPWDRSTEALRPQPHTCHKRAERSFHVMHAQRSLQAACHGEILLLAAEFNYKNHSEWPVTEKYRTHADDGTQKRHPCPQPIEAYRSTPKSDTKQDPGGRRNDPS